MLDLKLNVICVEHKVNYKKYLQIFQHQSFDEMSIILVQEVFYRPELDSFYADLRYLVWYK